MCFSTIAWNASVEAFIAPAIDWRSVLQGGHQITFKIPGKPKKVLLNAEYDVLAAGVSIKEN